MKNTMTTSQIIGKAGNLNGKRFAKYGETISEQQVKEATDKWQNFLKKQWLSKEFVNKCIDELEMGTGYDGIGHWKCDEDIEHFNDTIRRFKQKLEEG